VSQPKPALLLALLVGTAAAAQPFALARVPQQRDLTLPATPDAPVPEVYVAPGVLTTLVFPSSLERASVAVDEQVAHFALVDAGDRTFALEPRGEWDPRKRLGLKARLKDGTQVALVVTSHPTQVDGRVNLKRPRTVESLLAEVAQREAQLAALQAQCGEDDLVGLIRSGRLDGTGVQAHPFDKADASRSGTGPELLRGLGHRAGQWTLVDVTLRLPPGSKPWALAEARLVAPGGLTVPAVPIWRSKPRLAPGEEGRFILQTAKPHWNAGTKFHLEVPSGEGPPLLLGTVEL
jgi:uncharacterized protein (TIGR02268 family)